MSTKISPTTFRKLVRVAHYNYLQDPSFTQIISTVCFLGTSLIAAAKGKHKLTFTV